MTKVNNKEYWSLSKSTISNTQIVNKSQKISDSEN